MFKSERSKETFNDIKDKDGNDVIIPKGFICKVDELEKGDDKVSTLSYTDKEGATRTITFKRMTYTPANGEPTFGPPVEISDVAEVVTVGGARRSKSRKNRNNRRSTRRNRNNRRSSRRNRN